MNFDLGPFPSDCSVEITSSFKQTLELRDSYGPKVDFFASAKGTIPLSQAHEGQHHLYGVCQLSVLKSMAEYAVAVGAKLPPLPSDAWTPSAIEAAQSWLDRATTVPFQWWDSPRHLSSSHAVEAPSPIPAPPVDENPFKVTALPPAQPEDAPPAPLAVPDGPECPVCGGSGSSDGSDVKNPIPCAACAGTGYKQAPTVAPARRGRVAKKKEGEPYAPTAPEPPKVVDGGFQATLDDVPENIAAAQVSQLERFSAVIDGLGTGLIADLHGTPAWEANKAKGQEFLREFLGMKPLPKTIQKTIADPIDPNYERALPVLESFAKLYAGKLRSNPTESGAEAGNGYNQFVRAVDASPAWHKELATAAAIRHYPDCMHDLVAFMQIEPAIKGDNNVAVFLGLMAHHSREVAAKVRKFAAERSLDILELMKGLDLTKCSEGDILGRLVAR